MHPTINNTNHHQSNTLHWTNTSKSIQSTQRAAYAPTALDRPRPLPPTPADTNTTSRHQHRPHTRTYSRRGSTGSHARRNTMSERRILSSKVARNSPLPCRVKKPVQCGKSARQSTPITLRLPFDSRASPARAHPTRCEWPRRQIWPPPARWQTCRG